MSDLVSIIIPCYNAESYIAEAIESGLGQDYSDVEIVVVDDGSVDNSVEIVQRYCEQYAQPEMSGSGYRRVLLQQIDHRGACAARNIGLSLSHGDYVQFLDADDVLLPNKLSVQLPWLRRERYDLVFCNGYLFGDERSRRPIKRLRDLPSFEGADPFIYCLTHGFGTEGPLHRRLLLEKVGGFREGLIGGQEYDLHIRLGAAGARLHKVDDYLFCHRNHHDPNRITKKPKPAGFHTQMLIGMLERIEHDCPSALSHERARAFASLLFQSSIGSYRAGSEVTATQGFRLAQTLSPVIDYRARSLYKLVAQLASPLFAEACLKRIKAVKTRLHGAGHLQKISTVLPLQTRSHAKD